MQMIQFIQFYYSNKINMHVLQRSIGEGIDENRNFLLTVAIGFIIDGLDQGNQANTVNKVEDIILVGIPWSGLFNAGADSFQAVTTWSTKFKFLHNIFSHKLEDSIFVS